MKKAKLMEIIQEEIEQLVEASMSRKFKKATEALYDVQLKQQQLRKKFVAEKDPKKREKMKAELIKLHKVVQKVQSAFNAALMQYKDLFCEKNIGVFTFNISTLK